jgi:hypothetical protein
LCGQTRFESLAVGLTLDDQIISVAGKAIDGALRAHRVGEHGQPLIGSAVGGENHGSGTVTLGNDLVGIATLHRVHVVQREVIDEEQVDSEELPQFDFVGVVETGVFESLEHLIGAHCQHRVTVTAGNVAECVREKRFADADQASNIVPILRFSRSPFIIGFTHATGSVSALFVNMGFVANARMLSNSGMGR